MRQDVYKIEEIEEKGRKAVKGLTKEEASGAKGKVVVFNPEESEVAKNLNITEKGVYGIKR